MLVIDFETRSKVDIKKCGADIYASDTSTDIICLCAKDFETGQEYRWDTKERLPTAFKQALKDADLLMAVNARFDQAVYEYIGVPLYQLPPKLESQWYCIAAQFAVNAMPQSLDNATKALKTRHKKNPRGKTLINLLSKPNEQGKFNDDPDLRFEMLGYCMDDVRASLEAAKACRLMTQEEHFDWMVNERINERGVKIDLNLSHLAQHYAKDELTEIALKLFNTTGGLVAKSTQTQRFREWLMSNLPQELHDVMCVDKKNQKYSADKSVRAALLDRTDLPDDVRAAVELMDSASASSVSKFKRMEAMADFHDHRVRGAFRYYGASQTGRFSSKGLQLHNMARECFKPAEAEAVIRAMQAEKKIDAVMNTLKKLLRPALIPEGGRVFVVSDWSAIEARLLPWLSDSTGGEAMLDVFRRGEDVYVYTAEGMGSGFDRQIGKVATLALGFQGSVGAFKSMAKNYGISLPDNKVEQIVNAWRGSNPWAVVFWRDLERAAKKAMRKPTEAVEVGRVSYTYYPRLIGGTLVCTLPDGSLIQYPRARLDSVVTPWGEARKQITYMKSALTMGQGMKEWPRQALYGGLQAENCISGDAEVLTDSGWKRLDTVCIDDKVYDGVEFVKHNGLVNKGEQEVIRLNDVYMTPDHEVLTNDGWKTALEVQRYNRPTVRETDSNRACGNRRRKGSVAALLRLWRGEIVGGFGANEIAVEIPASLRLREECREEQNNSRHGQPSGVCSVAKYDGQMPTTNASSMEKLRGARDNCLRGLANFRAVLGGYGRNVSQRFDARQNRQQLRLQQVKLPMGFNDGASQQPAWECVDRHAGGQDDRCTSGQKIRRGAERVSVSDSERLETRGLLQTANVYDLMDCGDRNRFVIRANAESAPMIVHNCCQATSAALLRKALRDCDHAGIPVVAHTHDEVIIEIAEEEAQNKLLELTAIMEDVPVWATGLPLDAEGSIMLRYGK